MKFILLAFVLSGCTTLTYREGTTEFSRTSWFSNLNFSDLAIQYAPNGTKTVTLKGYQSDQVKIAEAVAKGITEGIKGAAVP